MTLKSLLTTVVVAAASASAFAFPTITLNPAPGKYDNVDYLATFNITGTGVTIVEDCPNKPYFDNLDTGDTVAADNFFTFQLGSTLTMMLTFDTANITENGEWELNFPAGCFKDEEGNLSDAMYFTYTLEDANLGIGNYPQITLLSSNPANGASIPYWGESLGKVTFKTSDDAAVNYIGWTLFDITNGTEPNQREWMRMGSENRIDVNRTFGSNSDQWVNGLFISVGGVDEKLLEGHTYRLALQFCGIGYDPVTNQYPTPNQISQSLELETYIDFKGQSAATQYSYWEVKEVTPDPEVYEFDNIDMRTFTIYYTGYVKPTMFIYSLGQGAGTASAGTYSPATDANAAGYAEAWDFTFSESLLKSSTGQLAVVIEAKDEDGLYVKGNGGFATDDFEYTISWNANAGADKLTSVEPLDGATVSQLGTIVIGNEGNKVMGLAYGNEEQPRIVNKARDGQTVVELGVPEFNTNTATWNLEEIITTPGTYSLIIPKWYFSVGPDSANTTNNQTTFTYIVEGEEEEVPANYDLMPESVSVNNGAVLTTPLDKFVLDFGQIIFSPFPSEQQPAKLYREVTSSARAEDYVLVEEVVNDWGDDDWMPMIYTYNFATPISENGNYKFVIPRGTFFDGTFDQTKGVSGHATPELVYNFSIGISTGLDAIAADAIVTVYDIAGREVLRNASAADLKGLASGVYIINGKKCMVK